MCVGIYICVLWQPRANWGGRTAPAPGTAPSPRTGSPREVRAVQRGGAGARIKRTRTITGIGITWGRETAEASYRTGHAHQTGQTAELERRGRGRTHQTVPTPMRFGEKTVAIETIPWPLNSRGHLHRERLQSIKYQAHRLVFVLTSRKKQSAALFHCGSAAAECLHPDLQ